jgi:hypothetical protein
LVIGVAAELLAQVARDQTVGIRLSGVGGAMNRLAIDVPFTYIGARKIKKGTRNFSHFLSFL